MKAAAIILFLLTYVMLIALPGKRSLVSLCFACIFVIFGIVPVYSVFKVINWNVLMMLVGTMGTVSLFIDSKMPNRMADMLLKNTKSISAVAVLMSVFAGVVSAFVDNVATVLMIAPVGLAIAKRLKISPIPLLISISVSSNLQGAATLVGDTTSILLGSFADMDFLDFFFMNGKPSIFWAVELGAIATIPVIILIFAGEKEKIESYGTTKVDDMFPTFLMILNIALLILASFVHNKPDITNGLICLAVCFLGLLNAVLKKGNLKIVLKVAKDIDYSTLLLLAGLFIVVEGITRAGIVEDISGIFVYFAGGNLLLLYSFIVWGSVIFSAFIDNIPYVATMLPVVGGIAALMGCSPYILYFGLLSGATLGGNLSPVGASANIAAIGILNRAGYKVSFKDFARIGIPFTLTAVFVSYIFLWIVWA